jgi:hypothetical protein
MPTTEVNLLPSQVFFGIAILAFVALVVMEKLHPYRRFTGKIVKESFMTNTTAFLFNNIILTALRATSLFFVAQQFSSHGLLSSMSDNPIKWFITFLLYDLAIYFWHVISHHYVFLWRFHKVHHSDKSFNTSTGFRFHVFDLFFSNASGIPDISFDSLGQMSYIGFRKNCGCGGSPCFEFGGDCCIERLHRRCASRKQRCARGDCAGKSVPAVHFCFPFC